MPITVSIVEDNDQLRGTLARVIGRAEGFQCVSHYGNAEDALKDLPNVRPEVVLMDINLPGINGVECVRQLKQLLPQTQVMMLTVYEDTENIFNALAAGSSGYMLKRTPRDELLDAIREVHRCGLFLGDFPEEALESYRTTRGAGRHAPTPREREVLQLVAEGKTTKEIAGLLGVSFKTAESHRAHIMDKLDIHETAGLVRFAIRHGLVSP